MKIDICPATMVVGIVVAISVSSMVYKVVAEVQQANVRTECYKTQQAAIAAGKTQLSCDK